MLFVICGPSGSGKTSLIKAAFKQNPSLAMITSCTTRKKRSTEIAGRDYHFFSKEAFAQKEREGEFLETICFNNEYYGVLKKSLIEATHLSNRLFVLAITTSGMRSAKMVDSSLTSIFVMPPSKAELIRRLSTRGESTDAIQRRIAGLTEHLKEVWEFDYVILNNCFDKALSQLTMIFSVATLTPKS